MGIPLRLTELLPADYAEHGRHLQFGIPVWSGRGVVVKLPNLLQHLPAMLEPMSAIYQTDDERVLLSQWSKAYIDLILPPVLVAAQLLERPLSMTLQQCSLLLHGGMPSMLWLPEGSLGAPVASPQQRYRSLLVDHLAPLFDDMAKAVRLSPKVLWNNLGNSLEYDLNTVYGSERARADIQYLFESCQFFDTGRPNPLRQTIRYLPSDRPPLSSPFRARKVCCLRDRAPEDVGLCSSCPLWLSMPQEEFDRHMAKNEG